MKTFLLQNWKFQYDDSPDAWYKGFNDAGWRDVIVPHDWSVTMPFSKEYSSGTGYLSGGIGWYRASFFIPEELRSKKVFITFDSVYKNSQVWCNSSYLGKRPSGYATFSYDISDFACFGEEVNVIAVKVSHEDISDSRWFTGSGLICKVSVHVHEPVYTPADSIFFTTPELDAHKAEVIVYSTVVNDTAESVKVSVTHTLRSLQSGVFLKMREIVDVPSASKKEVIVYGSLSPVELWSCETPHLYRLETKLEALLPCGKAICFESSPLQVGIRSIHFDADRGFFLNGIQKKIKGVCVHHDAGCLGAAVWPEVWQRRLQKLKAMGCNAIRMSHNPHMPELYDLCDEMGFLVMDEAFDEWENAKNKWHNGHNVYPASHQGCYEDFPQWHERDLSDLVKRDRNHPSIIMWSIGNEIDYPNDPYCHPLLKSMDAIIANNDKNKPKKEMEYDPNKPNAERIATIAAELAKIVKQHDPTRPVLAAYAFPELSSQIHLYDSLDVVGYNYKEHLYKQDHSRFPKLPLLGSENGHKLDAWKAVRDQEFICAQFLWTGIDFLGEAAGWPVHGSHSGLLDLAGFEKIAYFRRKALWTADPLVYLATRNAADCSGVEPHTLRRMWNYLPDEAVEVICYTNLEEAELYCNDVSYGKKKRGDDFEYLSWTVPFAWGSLRVEGIRPDGETVSDVLESTLPSAQIQLALWEEPARGPSVVPGVICPLAVRQIEVRMLDEAGRLNVLDNTLLRVSVNGPGRLLGLENGDLADNTAYSSPARRALQGRLLVFVLCDRTASESVSVNVSADGFLPAVICI